MPHDDLEKSVATLEDSGEVTAGTNRDVPFEEEYSDKCGRQLNEKNWNFRYVGCD